MGIILSTIIIAVSLSMDAFSLALIYGTVNISNNNKILLSVIVGLYHFFMPLLGLNIGSYINNYFIFDINFLVTFIFFVIGLEMVISSRNDSDIKILISLFGFLMFGFSVSIDSFTTGIGLDAINSNHLQVCFIFAVISSLFTYIGLLLGTKLNNLYGKYSTLFGGILLILMGIYYLFE